MIKHDKLSLALRPIFLIILAGVTMTFFAAVTWRANAHETRESL